MDDENGALQKSSAKQYGLMENLENRTGLAVSRGKVTACRTVTALQVWRLPVKNGEAS